MTDAEKIAALEKKVAELEALMPIIVQVLDSSANTTSGITDVLEIMTQKLLKLERRYV